MSRKIYSVIPVIVSESDNQSDEIICEITPTVSKSKYVPCENFVRDVNRSSSDIVKAVFEEIAASERCQGNK